LVESALGYLETAAKTGFDQTVISLKASDVPTTIEAYRLIAGRCPILCISGLPPPAAGKRPD